MMKNLAQHKNLSLLPSCTPPLLSLPLPSLFLYLSLAFPSFIRHPSRFFFYVYIFNTSHFSSISLFHILTLCLSFSASRCSFPPLLPLPSLPSSVFLISLLYFLILSVVTPHLTPFCLPLPSYPAIPPSQHPPSSLTSYGSVLTSLQDLT